MSKTVKDKIMAVLIADYGATQASLDDAQHMHRAEGISFEKALVSKGIIEEGELLSLMAQEMNVPFINLGKYKIDPSLRDIIPEKFARQHNLVPLSAFDFSITIGMSNPLDIFAVDDLKSITSKDIDVVISTEEGISRAINKFYGEEGIASVTEITKDIEVDDFEIVIQKDDDGSGDSLDESEKAPIIRMVNLIVKEAINKRASDIHIEPEEKSMRVRYRVDGILHEILEIPKENQNAIIVRIKILSNIDITATQIPQDGRFKMRMGKKEVDFRVSLLPTTYGQKVVLRILDKMNLSVGLAGLGFREKPLQLVNDAIKTPFGMILVTGPTGSGKSTTLYSIIGELNTPDKNIITVEDPVEYLIEGLTQIHARPEIGFTFAEGLKSILRQSPDIVMVGEIRDNETADIAIKASLTGQLVFSTLHTNDSAGALTRLIDMGVEPFLVASSIVMSSAQRLCRRICPKCKEKIEIPSAVLDELDFKFEKKPEFFHGKGCSNCNESGYRGRMGISEILAMDDDIRRMLLKGNSSDEIKEFARKEKGLETLFEDAMYKCLAGDTSLEEVMRVTSEE